jgi:uncharacterized protein YggE
MNKTAGLAILAALCGSGPALAQQTDQFASGLAAAVEGLGQSVGRSVLSGPNVFVTATGRTAISGARTSWYGTDVEGRAESAVEAARQRDSRLAAIEAQAKRFGVNFEIGSSTFTLEPDTPGRRRAGNLLAPGVYAQAALDGATPGTTGDGKTPPPAPKLVFIAKANLRFQAVDSTRLPGFLDAIRAAGVESLTGGPATPGMFNMFQNSQLLGFGDIEKVDDASWDRAGRAAMAEARRQAEVLAAAAGRSVGEPEQVMSLTRGIQGGEATVTVAVRYGFAPGKSAVSP